MQFIPARREPMTLIAVIDAVRRARIVRPAVADEGYPYEWEILVRTWVCAKHSASIVSGRARTLAEAMRSCEIASTIPPVHPPVPAESWTRIGGATPSIQYRLEVGAFVTIVQKGDPNEHQHDGTPSETWWWEVLNNDGSDETMNGGFCPTIDQAMDEAEDELLGLMSQ